LKKIILSNLIFIIFLNFSFGQVISTAASWANWAVGAIGSKFYKSAIKPPTPNTNQDTPAQTAVGTSSSNTNSSPTPTTASVVNLSKRENVKQGGGTFDGCF